MLPEPQHGLQRPSRAAPDDVRSRFSNALAGFDDRAPILVLAHNDADGLCGAAILLRALARAGRPAQWRLVGRGENASSKAMRAELDARRIGGLIAVDLAVGEGELAAGAPAVVIDHHAPRGLPAAEVITGWGMDPVPTSSLLAWWAAGALADVDDLLWLAALGLVGDMAEASGFPEMDQARRLYSITALKAATALINAPRRTAAGDASPALALLLRCAGPKEIVSGEHPETARLVAAKEEVAAELARARKVAPKIRKDVALIRFASPCQIHPLIAQAWRGRLKKQIVMAANTGFRPGWVHFAVRTARDLDLLAFLAERAPPGADENYGSGHRQATGGALRPADWNAFIRGLGFDPEDEVLS